MTVIGVLARRRIKNMDDYYMGGRRFGKAMMIMYAFGAGTHADRGLGCRSAPSSFTVWAFRVLVGSFRSTQATFGEELM